MANALRPQGRNVLARPARGNAIASNMPQSPNAMLRPHDRDALAREMAFAQQGPSPSPYPQQTRDYLGRVVSGEVAMEGLNRIGGIGDRMARGDPDAALEMAMEFGGAGIIGPARAIGLKGAKRLPKTTEFADAIKNTPGAKLSEHGLHLNVMRGQKPAQEAAEAIRTGVFYLPEGSASAKFYKNPQGSYGGSEVFSGETVVRNPLFAKGATGGKAIERAYDTLKGKGAYDKMRSDVLSSIGRNKSVESIEAVMSKYGANPRMAREILRVSTEGNTLPYAIQENIVAHAAREAGHDSIVGFSKKRTGDHFISELFDLREQTFPSNVIDPVIHELFE